MAAVPENLKRGDVFLNKGTLCLYLADLSDTFVDIRKEANTWFMQLTGRTPGRFMYNPQECKPLNINLFDVATSVAEKWK